MRQIEVFDLGTLGYAEALAIQEDRMRARIENRCVDALFCLQHPPVITLGRGAKRENIVASEEFLASRGIEVFETGRGGDVTLHAPGQLVVYPVIDLKPDRCDVRKYVRDLGEVMVRICRDLGVAASFLASPEIGVWANPENPKAFDETKDRAKVGAIGVRLSRWVTMHGFALNIATDLSLFDLIVPCGIRSHGVTSIERLGGQGKTKEKWASMAARHFADVFDASFSLVPEGTKLVIS